MKIFLIGMMGVGKSTVGNELAALLGCECLDLDEQVQKSAGITVCEIFEKFGESKFREIESEALFNISSSADMVIATGGGTPLSSENRKFIKNLNDKIVVRLTATPENIRKRLQGDAKRPLLKGKNTLEYIEKLSKEREEIYRELSDFVLDTDELTQRQLAEKIKELI